MRIKICGMTRLDQAQSIVQMGVTALGFICVPQSPRFIRPEQIRAIADQLPLHPLTGAMVERIGVFVDETVADLCRVVEQAGLSGVQLHGSESPQVCQELRAQLPHIQVIKALRVRDAATLTQALDYQHQVDALLLDAYNPAATHPGLYGGSGRTLDWSSLQSFQPSCPWLLAGGITPENVLQALRQLQPDGIDLSSGVERAPGDKDLDKVARLMEVLKPFSAQVPALDG
ncbi:MAG: phosphoribosylanthranilate isomerase [Synechococcales cyanobacterium C42_A2020_086]|nr:phosphoribosylanthranilate isomerase [Synechococcales cyanobacterium C42_A2020_086]